MKRYFPIWILFLVALSGGHPASGIAASPVLRLRREIGMDYQVLGNQAQGVEAFRMLIPVDWKFQGGIQGQRNKYGALTASGFCRAESPGGMEVYEVFPEQHFEWNTHPVFSGAASGYDQSGNIPPMKAVDYINYSFSHFRPQASNPRIVAIEPLSQVAQWIQTASARIGINVLAEPVIAHLEYNLGGIPVEEKFCVMILTYPLPSYQGTTSGFWYATNQISTRARKGAFPQRLQNIFETIGRSTWMNPNWVQYYQKITSQQNVIISGAQGEISNMTWDSYQRRQKTLDNIHGQQVQSIRGMNEYYNPFEGSPVDLPNGYSNVWASAQGEYILSDDPGFNPNIGSNVNWQRLNQSR